MSRDIHGASRPQDIELNYDDDDDDEGLVFSLNDGDPANNPSGNNSLEDDGEHDVVLKLSDLQGDPSSPLYSAKTFEQLGLYAHSSATITCFRLANFLDLMKSCAGFTTWGSGVPQRSKKWRYPFFLLTPLIT